jgi:FixJ family two-component response regulator
MNTRTGQIYLLDDNEDIRLHLTDALRQQGWQVASFATASEFLGQPRWVRPAVVVLDMRMPEMNGLAVQRQLHHLGQAIPIIFISGESQSQEIIDAMKGGAAEFLWKPFELDALLTAVESAMSTDAQQLDQQQLHLHVQALYSHLSVREKELLPLLLQGMSNKSIAAHTGVLADTVKKHRAHILAKMQVDNLASLLQLCKGFDPH